MTNLQSFSQEEQLLGVKALQMWLTPSHRVYIDSTRNKGWVRIYMIDGHRLDQISLAVARTMNEHFTWSKGVYIGRYPSEGEFMNELIKRVDMVFNYGWMP